LLKQLIHNGVIVPEPPKYYGLEITIKDAKRLLTIKQEEMAFAWVRKLGTPYVEDPVFRKNFLIDFCRELGIPPTADIRDIDFSPLIAIVDAERQAKEKLTKEERKALALERKEKREALKQKYGRAIADGEEIELANYLVEPSGIFMGRGKHPLRGRWKEGAKENDITLNLSPDAPVPPGNWKEVVWQPESLWVARWEDKLAAKQKYIWLHDSSPIKQKREAEKFDKATELGTLLENVRQHIENGLHSENPKIRKIATACYLIDALCLRVGDEKDPEEADTVGATTLRPEHIKLHDNGIAEFRFLGKDSVLWHKKIELPAVVRSNLQELKDDARPSASGRNKKNHPAHNRPQIFPDVSSRNVNAFLSEAMPGLTAKVFRTHHASKVVKESLDSADVTAGDPEYRKWEAATRANTEAAILCNHTKQVPKNWTQRKQKYREREERIKKQLQKYKVQLPALEQKLKTLKSEAKEKIQKIKDREKKKAIKERYDRRIESAAKAIATNKTRQEKTRIQFGRLRAQMAIAQQNRAWNLGTSQKSYIDPRIFYQWGKKVDYDVLEKFYSKTLRIKFQWVENGL
jgi:DNA topoisomerase-1